MKGPDETQEILRYLVAATFELNRCLLMAHHAKVKMSVIATMNSYEQDGKQVEFPGVKVHVDPKCLVSD